MKYLLIFALAALVPSALSAQTAIPRALTVADDGTILVATSSPGDAGVMQMKLTGYNPDGTLRGNITRTVDAATPSIMQMAATSGGDVVIAGTGGDQQSPEDIVVFGFDLSTIVAVDEPGNPAAFRLSPAYPNPVSGDAVTVAFELERQTAYRLSIRDLNGREVRVAESGTLPPGQYQHQLATSGLKTGTYFIVFESPHGVSTRKILVAP